MNLRTAPRLPLLAAAGLIAGGGLGDAATVMVGDDPAQFNIGWMDGACYLPVEDVRVGDVLQFEYGGHNVYKMKDGRSYERCDFDDAELLGDVGASPYFYTVTEEDREGGDLYFACKIGSHCQGQQKLRVYVSPEGDEGEREEDPVSAFVLGVSSYACDQVQNGEVDPASLQGSMESSCSDPVPLDEVDAPFIHVDADDARPWMFTSCLSPPVTLTPGGVINQATVLHFPYPTDRRVLMGSRIWEFVQGDTDEDGGGVDLVNVNQLYVHHILGGVVMGNGAESIRRSDEDAAFPAPFGRLSGDFDDTMTFHLIDLREVDQWLECAECRCRAADGSFLEEGGAGEGAAIFALGADGEEDDYEGGISCCSNCTDLTSPTVDYRLRYNITYMEIPEDEPIQPIVMLSADISPAADRSIEFDVPKYTDLPPNQRLSEDPTVQVLTRVGTFREIFQPGFFEGQYRGPDQIEIHRCTGHMHIGGMEQWLEDAETGEVLCHSKTVYGNDPEVDKGFLTSIGVQNFEEKPIVVSADTRIRLTTHYDASIVHTGVMGMFFLFVSEFEEVTADKAALRVDVCASRTCDASMLPSADELTTCEDGITDPDNFICRFTGVCDCETFLASDRVTGCGGVVMTGAFGNFSVDNFCAETCGCKHLEREGARDKMLQEGIEDLIEADVRSLCHYSSEECHEYLNNMYSCADEKPGSEELDDFVRSMMVKKGRRMALDHAKLGSRAIHRFDTVVIDEYQVPMCGEPLVVELPASLGVGEPFDEEPEESEGSAVSPGMSEPVAEESSTSSGAGSGVGSLVMTFAALGTLLVIM